MIDRIWSGFSFYHLLLLPFSWLYGFIVIFIRYSYRFGLRKIYKFPLSILIIGNLTVGGNGKTPMVLWLVKQLQSRGWLVGVVSRGYGGKSKQYPIIVNSLSTSNECGDEPLLIWQRTGVPVAVSPNRVDAVSFLLCRYKLDIIVSDDGLQHYALDRDIEWVVISDEQRFGNGWLLPTGPMREKISRLSSVHEIIINGGKTKPGEISMKLSPTSIINLVSGKSYELIYFKKKVVAMAGIAFPDRFFSTLRANGIFPMKEIIFSDHAVYCEKNLARLVLNSEVLLMTEKDAVKCRKFAHINWWYLRVDVVLSQMSTNRLLRSVENNITKYHKVDGC